MRAPASPADTRRQFDLIADGWDAEQGPVSARASEFAARIEYLRAICRDFHRPRVLDLGCGTGQILLHLADVIARGVGIDISPAMIARARRNAAGMRLQFREDDAADFCMHCPDRFELVLLIGVLEHLSDQAAGLAEASRVLTDDGRLVVIAPHPWNPFFRLKRLIDGGRDAPPADHPSPLSLRRLAARHGLELLATQALPYTAWIEFNAVHTDRPSTESRARSNPFAGLLRGAFASEFRRDRYDFVDENSRRRTAGTEFVRDRGMRSRLNVGKNLLAQAFPLQITQR
jgi:SAM-dependent methyltransferase